MKATTNRVVIFGLLFFAISFFMPAGSPAQTLPPWYTPWGSTLGLGYPWGYGIDLFSFYNTAASFSPIIPFTPYSFTPYQVPYAAPVPAYIPPAPVLRNAAATITLALPTASVVPGLLPVVSAPIISTTQLFLGLLLTIGEESGLFLTNPALFWYIVGILY